MRRRYDRSGILAVNPQAFFDFFLDPPERANTTAGDVAIVDIRGPLDHHPGWWCDSYDEILERVAAACSSNASAIVLRIDSPGGEASGCFEAARAIREKCGAAGKRLVAYVDGQACSAAYALACAAEEISASETGILGSIGVLNARFDASGYEKQLGFRVALTTSGARKADGHPSLPISEAEMVATQGIVDSLAGSFFELVQDLRGLPVAKVEALEAGIFHGAQALEAGLADQIEPFSALLARLAGAEGNSMSKYDEARAALEEAAKGEGEDAERARKALKAMDEGDEPAAEGEGGDEDEGDEPAAESEDSEEEEEPSSSSSASRAGAGTVAASTAGELGATANTLAARVAKLERQAEGRERRSLLASRPDLSPELVKVLETKPLAEVQAIVGAIKKPKAAKLGDRAAAATPAATRGDGQGDGTAARLPPDQKHALDLRMGLVGNKPGVTSTPHKLTLGVPVPSTGAAAGEKQAAGAAGKVA